MVSSRSTILKSKILCNVLLFWCIMSQEINGKEWGVFMCKTSICFCFPLFSSRLSRLLSKLLALRGIYAILSCSLQIGKALTYRKLDGFATEAKKIMQTCTDSLYIGKNTTHTEDSKLCSFPLLKELFLCEFQKILHEDKKHYASFLCLDLFAAIPT